MKVLFNRHDRGHLKKKVLLFAVPSVLVLPLAFYIMINREPENPFLKPSAITWDESRRDSLIVTATVEDEIAIVRYSNGREERTQLIKDEQMNFRNPLLPP